MREQWFSGGVNSRGKCHLPISDRISFESGKFLDLHPNLSQCRRWYCFQLYHCTQVNSCECRLDTGRYVEPYLSTPELDWLIVTPFVWLHMLCLGEFWALSIIMSWSLSGIVSKVLDWQGLYSSQADSLEAKVCELALCWSFCSTQALSWGICAVLWLTWVGSNVASVCSKVSRIPIVSRIEGSRVFWGSVHSEVGRWLREVPGVRSGEVRYIPRRSNLVY